MPMNPKSELVLKTIEISPEMGPLIRLCCGLVSLILVILVSNDLHPKKVGFSMIVKPTFMRKTLFRSSSRRMPVLPEEQGRHIVSQLTRLSFLDSLDESK